MKNDRVDIVGPVPDQDRGRAPDRRAPRAVEHARVAVGERDGAELVREEVGINQVHQVQVAGLARPLRGHQVRAARRRHADVSSLGRPLGAQENDADSWRAIAGADRVLRAGTIYQATSSIHQQRHLHVAASLAAHDGQPK